jgi:hypothetical protein
MKLNLAPRNNRQTSWQYKLIAHILLLLLLSKTVLPLGLSQVKKENTGEKAE